MRETECLVNLDASSSNSCRTFPPEVVHRLARPIREESVVHHTRLRHNTQYVLSPLRSPKVPDREWHTRTRRQEGRMACDFSCVAIIPDVLPSGTCSTHCTPPVSPNPPHRHASALPSHLWSPKQYQSSRITKLPSSHRRHRGPYNTPIGSSHLPSHLNHRFPDPSKPSRITHPTPPQWRSTHPPGRPSRVHATTRTRRTTRSAPTAAGSAGTARSSALARELGG